MEWVNRNIKPLLQQHTSWQNVLHTYSIHVAQQVARMVSKYQSVSRVMVTGGGAWNSYLMELLRKQAPEVEWFIPDEKLVNFKEAILFAFLGALKLAGEENVYCSVTGSSRNSKSGVHYQF